VSRTSKPVTPRSSRLPTTPESLLLWAADHLEHVGWYRSDDGERFAPGSSHVADSACSMIGALDVAGGEGRRTSQHCENHPALRFAAQLAALDELSDLLAGGAVTIPHDAAEERQFRRDLLHVWSTSPGRSVEEVTAALRAGAARCRRAAAALEQVAAPPQRLPTVTASHVLGWAAQHLSAVGLRRGPENFDPAGFGDSAPCTVLHAFDRAQRAARADPDQPVEVWTWSREARTEALRSLSDTVAGGAIGDPAPTHSGQQAQEAHRRTLVGQWAQMPGRTLAEVTAVFRSAAAAAEPASGIEVQAVVQRLALAGVREAVCGGAPCHHLSRACPEGSSGFAVGAGEPLEHPGWVLVAGHGPDAGAVLARVRRSASRWGARVDDGPWASAVWLSRGDGAHRLPFGGQS